MKKQVRLRKIKAKVSDEETRLLLPELFDTRNQFSGKYLPAGG